MIYRLITSLILTGALAACGGSGTGILGSDSLPGPPEFNALLLEADSQAAKLEVLNPSISLPTENGVRYEGVMLAATSFDSAAEGYLGTFTAVVDFADGEITGEGTGFFLSSVDGDGNATGPGVEVPGTVDVASTNVATGPVDFSFDGSLFVDGLERTISDGSGVGGFLGPDGDMMAIEGDLEFDGTSTGLEVAIVAD